MFSKILVATDLSAASYAVTQCATGFRSLGAKECILLQCLNLSEAASAAVAQQKGILERSLLDQKAILEKSGLKVHAEVVTGNAAIEINRIAREREVSLVVVGSHGHTLAGELLLGGVANAVIHHAVKPVLVVRVERKPATGEVCVKGETCDFVRHVLFPTDFSDHADHAFQRVKHLVASGAREVTLLHVQDKNRIDPHLMHRLEEFNRLDRIRLAEMKDALAKSGSATIHDEVCFGHPVQEILHRIESKGITLVVMGSQGRGFISEVFLGSVSHNIARHSPAPVMLVPARR